MKIKKYQGGNSIEVDEIDGGYIQPAVVKPSATQNRYYDTLYQQLPESVRKQIRTVWTAAQNQDFGNGKAKDYESSIDRLMDVYELAGSPKIKTNGISFRGGKPRPNASLYNRLYNISNVGDLISELAHPIQYKYTDTGGLFDTVKSFVSIPFMPGKTLYDKQMHAYQTPTNMEYKTHELVEPLLEAYIDQDENAPKDLGELKWRLSFHRKGGSIHIKPENKGKFNATKKRTGKSTEELTHSKNPLTRKRAIFAQNMAKIRNH